MKNIFRVLFFFNFMTLTLAANAKEFSTAKCNIDKYKAAIVNIIKNNDELVEPGDVINTSVGSHDQQYFQSNLFAGLTSMSQRFSAMNTRTNKSIEGSLIFNVYIENDNIQKCSLKAILLD
ncbi:MAG: hypothetical protein L6Q37_05565 [Bdellovibrionaceae bacterium]|nr:hypothetical protein [Pseudobdellovibrionaceae bacterium]NUM57021.1 hypothetical protein [Pseudobdellovibrionaceae bacterium]